MSGVINNGVRSGLALLLIMLFIIAVVGPTFGQSRSEGRAALRVLVLDQSGAAVAGASVVVNPDSAGKLSSTTNEKGEAVFEQMPVARCRVRIEAKGFEPGETERLALKPGLTHIEVRLEVVRLVEQLDVTRSKQEKQTDPRGNGFSNVLTEDQIAALPDDPEQFEQAIRALAGPGAVMRVNGFAGGKLPPKSQIREIRFKLNSFAAENHEAGMIAVDILTKPGTSDWRGALSFGFRDEALAARNVFAPVRGPEQLRRTAFSLDGPIWRKRTSLFLSGDATQSFDSKTIVAALPDGALNELITRPSRVLNLSARFEHLVSGSHTLRGEYQRNAAKRENLGAGDFNLPERAYTTDQTEHLLRLSETGLLGERLYNELRFQTRWNNAAIEPVSSLPAVIVLNAFSAGGAQVRSNRRSTEVEVFDGVDFSFGKHAMKAGALIEFGRYDSLNQQNFTGTFTFASLDAYNAARPTTFAIRTGDPRVSYNTAQFGWFWQDDMRLRKNLTASVGVRYEAQTHVRDWNNFAPRASLTWSPFRDGKTTLRAGAGIFYDWFTGETYEQTLLVDGVKQRDRIVQNPGYPNPFGGGTGSILPPSRIERDPAMRLPYISAVSLGVERQLPAMLQLRANYSYQRGVHLLRGHNINAPADDSGRPDPATGNINRVESTANSSRHMLHLGLDRQFSKRLFFTTGYMLSKVTDETDGPLSLPANNFDLRAERGPSAQDTRHRFLAVTN
ncbi:MAG TPA: TonB-dependent receptor, partial [Blastocatellia bacterium]|nr:TonB-dependent receptor [Blastocatellia bacterium]